MDDTGFSLYPLFNRSHEEQGLDSRLLDELYKEARKLETLYGLLVIKNGTLIAEGYFNAGSIDQVSGRQSSTKSFTSALVGIAWKYEGAVNRLVGRSIRSLPRE